MAWNMSFTWYYSLLKSTSNDSVITAIGSNIVCDIYVYNGLDT